VNDDAAKGCTVGLLLMSLLGIAGITLWLVLR